MDKTVTDQEKDEVIAKWAGFRFCEAFQGWNDRWAPPGIGIDDVWDHVGTLPDFTDLTVLFKWCGPQLSFWRVGVRRELWGGGYHALVEKDGVRCDGDAPTPGEALKAAILAMIGGAT